MSLDIKLFRLINGMAKTSRWLDYFGIFCAVYLIFFMGAGALAFFFYMPKEGENVSWLKEQHSRLKYLFVLIGGSAASYLVSILIGFGTGRLRPFANSLEVHQLVSASFSHKSFPSSHATVAFAIAMSVFLFNRTWGIPMLAAAFLVSWGRVFVGVHYPSDVVAGAILGALGSYIIYKLI
ncbi:MAG: phosphatase PAP2 family protein [Patescibacteria group bacterium]